MYHQQDIEAQARYEHHYEDALEGALEELDIPYFRRGIRCGETVNTYHILYHQNYTQAPQQVCEDALHRALQELKHSRIRQVTGH